MNLNNEVILDNFINNNKTYIHLNPKFFYYKLKESDIKLYNRNYDLINFKFIQNNTFNPVFYIIINEEIEEITVEIEKLNLNNKLKNIKINNDKKFLQMVIMFKNEYKYIENYINYYKTFFDIDRFILIDNNSNTSFEEFNNFKKNRKDIEYFKFNLNYIFKEKYLPDPKFCIIAQNSAYSIALTKYNSEWTMFFDLDEYIKPNFNLKKMLSETDNKISSFVFTGYWAGCKNGNDPFKINYRSDIKCNTKLILKNSKNDFTNMIHYPQYKNTAIYLDIDNYYYYHIISQSGKRTCDCKIYDKIIDPIN